MGIEPFLVTASVNLVLSRNGSRVASAPTARSAEKHPEALLKMGMTDEQIRKGTIMKGKGCGTCSQTGYKSRVALYEVMPFADPLEASCCKARRRGDQDRDDPRRHAGPSPRRHPEKILEGVTTPKKSSAPRWMTSGGAQVAALLAMLDKGASDLHITAGSPPRLRIDNELVKLQTEPLTPVDTKTLCYSVMNDAQKLRFEEDLEIDFSFGIVASRGFRRERLHAAVVRRGRVPNRPVSDRPLEDLGLPAWSPS